jgi:hypothetical protein
VEPRTRSRAPEAELPLGAQHLRLLPLIQPPVVGAGEEELTPLLQRDAERAAAVLAPSRDEGVAEQLQPIAPMRD